jgi:hypothetical protein
MLYLVHNESFHPNNCKISIIYSQALRYVRLITNRNRLSERLQDLRVNLITRGYTNNIIDNAFNKPLQYTQSNLLIDENQVNKNKTVRIDDKSTNQCPTNEPNSNKPILTFSEPYNTNTTHIGSILRKYWHLIDLDPSLKLLWPERPNPLWFPTNATITLRIAKCIPSSQIINTNEINSRTNTTSDSGFDMMRYVYWSFVIGRGNSGYFGHVFTTETSRFEQ